MKWLAPLIIVIILIVFGAWFCGGKHEEPAAPVKKPAVNANVANAANTNSANINTASNTNAVVVNAPANTNSNANFNK